MFAGHDALSRVLHAPKERRALAPGVWARGGAGGISARLEDLDLAAALLRGVADGLAVLTDQVRGAQRDATAWSQRLQARLAADASSGAVGAVGAVGATSAAGGAAPAALAAGDALTAFRSRITMLTFGVDACAARVAELEEDVRDVAERLGRARSRYEQAELRASGLIQERRRALSLSGTDRFAHLGLGLAWGASWAATNVVDGVAGRFGWRPGLREKLLPGTEEMIVNLAGHARGVVGFTRLLGGDPGNSLAWATRKLATVIGQTRLPTLGVTVSALAGAAPPRARTVTDMARTLREVSRAHKGGVGVQRTRLGDGRSAWVVFVPGTDGDLFTGEVRKSHGRDWEAAPRIVAGVKAASAVAVEKALRAAGARAGDDVSFVGHSQGGSISKMLAADQSFRRQYRVRAVLSFAGPTPVGVQDVPGVTYVDVENSRDAVTYADGRRPRDTPDHTTIVVDDVDLDDRALAARVGRDRHGLDTQVDIMDVVARSTDPGVRTALSAVESAARGGASGPVERGDGSLLATVDPVRVYLPTAR